MLECGLQCGDLLIDDLLVFFILLYDDIALLALDRDRRDLRRKRACLPCALRSLVRLDGMSVLGFPRDLVLLRTSLTAETHGGLVISVQETVVLERVLGLELAEDGVLAGNEEAMIIDEGD